MEIERTEIDGLVIISPRLFGDDRGTFHESYSKVRYDALLGATDFVQDNVSVSCKDTLRGLHFQRPPMAQAKLVSVLRGAALDVAVDIRKGSPTYGKYFSVLLTAADMKQFFVPRGFAHGFLALEDDTVFSYKCDGAYSHADEGSIRWNDPQIGIEWGITTPLLSPKDEIAPLFAELDSPF